MKKIKFLAISFVFICYFSCDKKKTTVIEEIDSQIEETDTDVDETQKDSGSDVVFSNQIISINPNDPLLFSITSENDEIVQFYGEKDADGVATKCNLISVQESATDNPVLISLDDMARPVDVIGNDGSAISFNYDDPNDINVNVVYPNNEYILNFSLNGESSKNDLSDKKSTRTGKKMSLASHIKSPKATFQSCANADLKVSLSECGELQSDNYFVELLVKSEDPGKELFRRGLWSPTPDANGNFCFNTTFQPTFTQVDYEKMCTGLSTVLGYTCIGIGAINLTPGVSQTVCASIAAAANVAAAPTFAACESLNKALVLACATLAASPAEGVDSVLDNICKSEVLEKNPGPETYYFEPIVMRPGKPKYVGPKTKSYPATGPFDNISVTLPSEPAIGDFYTVPFDPNPETDYVATALIQCLDEPTSATITIVGTDGFTDSFTMELPAGNSSISLNVPGAEGGVLDRITVILGNLTSNRVIIF